MHVTDEVGEELDGITEEGLRAAVFLELGGKVANGAGDAKVVHAVTGIDVAAFPSQGIMKGVHKVQRVTPGVRRVYKRIRMKEEKQAKKGKPLTPDVISPGADICEGLVVGEAQDVGPRLIGEVVLGNLG